ncbi:MAG TPA: maltose alpha-D-glucosyltransferase [Terracidiphilus sp.]|nr:maltose alpha-D-glucosyltransferase [Terracidiphilus sp.]
MKKYASATDPLWYKDAIIYELHVRAFADSNGDGIGDFPGLLSKLDYLQDLGVTCIWLLPFFPSPLRDDGYDISNYVDVNPSYGTLNDFKAFLEAAHRREMQVMIELVINHTSDQHPWFKAARLAPPGSPQREMYVWSNTDQLYKDARIIFTDTEKSNWTWDDTAKAYYWHRFFSHQPDLNFKNPLVLEEVLKAMRFWLDMGVDGLRMDAIPYLCERDGTSCENLPETHAVIQQIRAAIDAEYADRLILAEANQWPADVRPYFGDGDECHMAFHFPLMPRIYMALRQEDRLPITDIMAQTPPIPENCQWALFLRNHDELTLEMVTADERDYMYLAYSTDPRMRVNVGIRRRLAPLVDNNRRRIELLNSLLFSFPGTPILYYGDEIGMGDNIYLGDRNGVRTPMQWNSDRNAGFSRCDPARLYFPVIMDPIYGYQVVNVEAQLSDQSSLLHWTRNMIALRKLFQVFGRGTLKFLNPSNRKVLAYLRDLDRGDGTHETVLCVSNLSRFAQAASLDLADYAGSEPVEMLGYVPFPTVGDTPYAITLAPYSSLWLELQPAGAKPEASAGLPVTATEDAAENAASADLVIRGWPALLTANGQAWFNAALLNWLPQQRWFGAKSRKIQSTRVVDWAELPLADDGNPPPRSARLWPALVFVEVEYAGNPSEIYQLPLSVAFGPEADNLAADRSQSILATIAAPSGIAVLHDATVREDFRQSLLRLIGDSGKLRLSPDDQAVHPSAASLRDCAEPSSATASSDSPAASPQPAAIPVAPVPITTQPGEAAAPPRDETTTSHPSGAQSAPRESPGAGPAAQAEGRVEGRPAAAFLELNRDGKLPSRIGSAEQSNTSILYGSKLILKIFRRLQPGENPDVEIGRFLCEVARFSHIPPYYGEVPMITSGGEKTTIAMLQGLVVNEGDGWQWFLAQLESFLQAVRELPGPSQPPSTAALPGEAPDAEIQHYAAESLQASALLGRRTAEMHLALATSTSDPAFGAEPFTAEWLARDARLIEAQIASALDTLRIKVATLKDTLADQAALLLSRRLDLLSRAHAITGIAAAGRRIRIHGDYHLGQTLRVSGATRESGDFVILDFEGEPARPLAERRQKQSPLKDVAGMIRSLSYAAASALDRCLEANLDLAQDADAERLQSWAAAWQNAASAHFLEAYRGTIAAQPSLLPPPAESRTLLSAYILEKALYELLYELNNRPGWLRIPLSGILNL